MTLPASLDCLVLHGFWRERCHLRGCSQLDRLLARSRAHRRPSHRTAQLGGGFAARRDCGGSFLKQFTQKPRGKKGSRKSLPHHKFPLTGVLASFVLALADAKPIGAGDSPWLRVAHFSLTAVRYTTKMSGRMGASHGQSPGLQWAATAHPHSSTSNDQRSTINDQASPRPSALCTPHLHASTGRLMLHVETHRCVQPLLLDCVIRPTWERTCLGQDESLPADSEGTSHCAIACRQHHPSILSGRFSALDSAVLCRVSQTWGVLRGG